MNDHPRTLTLLVRSVLLLLALVSSTSAQTPDSSTKSHPPSEGIQKRDNEWGVWGGISFDSTTLIGKTPDAKFGNIGLRYGRVLKTSKTVAFEWTIDVIPVSVLSNPRPEVTSVGPGFTITSLVRHSVYGFGAAPIGLKFNFRRNRRVQPFGQATGGFLYFNRQAPVDDSSRFNFTFDFSGGVQIVNSNRRSFTIGYKYQHISNGYTGTFNPGVDVQMVFAGFSIFK
jgi:opacity protein-like surface antigen